MNILSGIDFFGIAYVKINLIWFSKITDRCYIYYDILFCYSKIVQIKWYTKDAISEKSKEYIVMLGLMVENFLINMLKTIKNMRKNCISCYWSGRWLHSWLSNILSIFL